MRVALILVALTLALTGCKREAQETVAQAKGAAADAERAAREAAAQAQSTADHAAASARSAADQAKATADETAARARAAADDAAAKARSAAGAATDSARKSLDNASQTVRELAAGDQVQGVLVSAGRTEVDVRPESGPVRTLHTDDRTRWVLHGGAASSAGFPIGSSVRVTYIAKDGQLLATQVEAVGH